uniref:Transcription and mRNA export factor ENY2 n=1 Tax=Romanomermis culicivorax TaxID=13658 RepID=A0A915KWT5_ROMCU
MATFGTAKKHYLEEKLIESGEKEKLMQLLRKRLMESGWCDQVKKQCIKTINDKGVENITLDQLLQEVSPSARQSVPDAVKMELLQQLRGFLQQHSGISDL